jgi:hypothetical protein
MRAMRHNSGSLLGEFESGPLGQTLSRSQSIEDDQESQADRVGKQCLVLRSKSPL